MSAVLEAGRFDCRAGKGAEDRYSQLDRDYAGGAGRILGCSHRSLHTPVEVGTQELRADTRLLAALLSAAMTLCVVPNAHSQDSGKGVEPTAPSAADSTKKSTNTSADASTSEGATKRFFGGAVTDFTQDQKHIWTSPAHIRLVDATWLVPLAGITAGLFVTDKQYSASLSTNPNTISHYKTLSNVGIASLAGAGAGMYLMSFPTHNEHWRETGFLAGEAAIDSLIPIEVMKYSLGRDRPYQGNGSGAFFQGGTSFPSEHAAAAWAIAGVIAHEYPGNIPQTDFVRPRLRGQLCPSSQPDSTFRPTCSLAACWDI